MFNKNVVVILIAGALSTLSAGAVERGGYGVGNGGDGLELANASVLRDVVVPLPAELSGAGILEVVGSPSPGQPDVASLRFVKTDEAGVPKMGGMSRKAESVNLNEPRMLSAGVYFVEYAKTYLFIQIKDQQKTVVELQKLQIPMSQMTIQAKVDDDRLHLSEQEELLKTYFAAGWGSDAAETAARKSWCEGKGQSAEDEALLAEGCKAYFHYKSYRDWEKVIRFTSTGDVEQLAGVYNRIKWVKLEAAPIATLKPGEFFSVLPGVYAITFTDTQTGQTKTVRGIDVR